MNPIIEQEIKILWADFDVYDVDQKLASFERLKNAAKEEDLSRLIELLKSEKSDFWVRELLSEPICELGGTKYLDDLFDALELNKQEGHDNDLFLHFLTELAETDTEGCRQSLMNLLQNPEFKHKEAAEWLLSFCR